MTDNQRKILVTSALPYANGSIHLGHLLEHIQTDIWTRFQRMRGHQCYSVCADDAHGTPVMLKAQELGITPEEMVTQTRAEHHQDLLDFGISYDNYYVTHSDENRELCELIYNRLNDAGYIVKRTINQLFDPEKQMFLPDRFVKGTCHNFPICYRNGWPAEPFKPKWLTSFRNGLPMVCSNGTSAVMHPILVLKFRERQANTSMYGWMRRLATWPASRTSVITTM